MYDELLRNWQGVLARVGEDLAFTWPGRSHRATVEIENFLSEQHRHHVFDWRDLEGRADVVSWVKETYFALRASDPVPVLDQVRDELLQADTAFGPIVEEARLAFKASQEQAREVAAARDALAADLEARDLALEARAAEVRQLQEEVGHLNGAIAAAASQATTHQAEAVALRAERDDLEREVERVGAELRRLAAEVEAAEGRVNAADTEAASRREELTARDLALEARAAEVRQLQEELGHLNDAIAASASQATTHQAEAVALRAERDHLVRELERVGAELRRLAAEVDAAERRVGVADAEAARVREELTAAHTELERLRTAADEATSRAAAVEANSSAERDKLSADLATAQAEIAQLQQRAAVANAAMDALEARAAADRDELLRDLEEARARAHQLTERIYEVEREAGAERKRLLSDLDAANFEANRLANELAAKSLAAEELAFTADELLSTADAELEASRAEQDRLQTEIANAVEQHGQLLVLVGHLEASVERATAALSEHEQAAAAAVAGESAARAEFDAERSRLLQESEAARTELENARTEVELVQNELQVLRSEGANDRAAFIAELDAARTEAERLLAELETARTDAERRAARTAGLQAELDAYKALVHAVESVTGRRTPRRRTLSHLGTWLLPPTPRKLNYLWQYFLLRWTGRFDVDSYLLANPDVLAAGVNPLMHYIQYGREEGRAEAIQVSSSDDPAGTQASWPTAEVGSAGAELRDDLQVQTIQTPGAASSVDDLVGTAFPLLRPLRVFPTPTKQGRRLTLVTDSLNEGSLFGGVGTSIVLGSLLAQRLDASLRIVTRLVPPNPANFGIVQRSQEVEFDRNVEFVSIPLEGYESLPLHDRDLFLTTSWWSTWSTIRAVSPERVVYLIQEDERMFYPAGDEQAACSETIADSRIRFVVNTSMLRDHLVQEGFSNIDRRGIAFEPAFPETLFFPEARPADDPRRTFFFYARPNNVRNLFLRGLTAIDEAISADILDPDEWRFHFVGSGIPSIQLNRGVSPIVSENLPWPAYAALIRSVDLGLSLMSTPHPSYPPLDLAACGAVAVTNRYGVKQELNAYSSNIICTDLAHGSIVEGVAAGVRLAQDSMTRHRNYETQNLSRRWDSSLSAVLDWLSDWP